MTDEPLPPDEDTAPPADPFEAELVAYLDGELEPLAARKVENRLATDPAARDKAAALKKTYDLLDYLPKPEPSPTFTSRTLERLPVSKSTPTQPVVEAARSGQLRQSLRRQSCPLRGFRWPSRYRLPPGCSSSRPSRWGLWARWCLACSARLRCCGYFRIGSTRPT
ncbi:MAG: hypothetical protein U0792_24685 [Gemmataceae bacterium]